MLVRRAKSNLFIAEISMKMKNLAYASLMLALVLIVASCGGGGIKLNPNPTTNYGSITGKFIANNFLTEGAVLRVALYLQGSATATAQDNAIADGDDWGFAFERVPYGVYFVRLSAAVDDKTLVLNQSEPITVSSTTPNHTDVMPVAIGIDGTISGIVRVAGDYPSDKMVFVNLTRTDVTLNPGPPDELNNITFDVPETLIENGEFRYDIENASYGVYTIQLVGYDLTTHALEVYGEYDGDIVIDYLDHNLFSHNFAAGFGVEPPSLEEGIIRGTVTFTGTPDWSQSIYVSANTIPPGAGAPPGNYQIEQATYNAAGVEFEMRNLVYGEYSVSIYQYNFTTHQATYFGVHDGNVTIDAANPSVNGIDFEADWSLLP